MMKRTYFISLILFFARLTQADLIQHLDATLSDSISTNSSGMVTRWGDQSAYGNHAYDEVGDVTYPSASLSATGLAGLDFGAGRNSLELFTAPESDAWLDQRMGLGFCVLVAFKANGVRKNWNDLLGNGSAVASGFGLRFSDGGMMQAYLGGKTINKGGQAVVGGDTLVVSFNYNATTQSYDFWDSRNDSTISGAVVTADFSTTAPVTLGSTTNSGRYFHGLVGEVKVFDTALNNQELKAEQKDMVCRWITGTEAHAGQPNIVSVKYSDADVAVVSYNATSAPYHADPTGQTDATVAVQRTIDDCAKALGGVVYLPEGEYRIEGHLELQPGVTLRGDWAQPTSADKTVRGTILNLYHTEGKGVDSDAVEVQSPIVLANSTGIRDLSVFYPEQNVTAPVAYPYTIHCKGKMQTVMNVTLVNVYRGIRYEPDKNSVGHPNVRQVYGSPLYKGLRLNKVAAVPRILELHFTPDYWVESGLPGSPTKSEFLQASRALESVGVEIAQSDNGILGNLELSGYDTGLLIGASNQSSNMKLYDFRITNCRVGIHAQKYKVQGWNFSKGTINVDGDGALAVLQTGAETLLFHSCSFASTGQMVASTSGGLGFTKCHFQAWQQGHGIDKSGGRLIAYGNTFEQALGTGQVHIHLSSEVSQAAIAANDFRYSDARILTPGSNPKDVVVDLNPSTTFYEPNYSSYSLVDYFKPARQDSDSLFDVQDYGAVGDCETDNTEAFRGALAAAEQYGGGTVYVPGGAYRIDGSLVVPSGVELRGVHDLPHYTGNSRSILLSYVDMDHPPEEALISLSAHAGIRGLLIVRPQQKYDVHTNDTTIFDLPFVIRSLGEDTSIVNITIANADKGIDLAYAAGGGHRIRWYLSAPLGQNLNILADDEPSYIENMQTNPGLFRGIRNSQDWTLFTDNKAVSDELKWNVGPLVADSPGLWPYGTAVNVYGDGPVSFCANFYNSPYRGIVINGSPHMTSLLSGGEGDHFYRVESEGPGDIELVIINNTYHPIAKTDDTSFGSFNLKKDSTGSIKILNTISFGAPPLGYHINNGSLVIQSTYQTVSLPEYVRAEGNASVSIEGAYLRNGMSAYHGRCLDAASFLRMAGTLSDNTYRVSDNVEVTGSSPRH